MGHAQVANVSCRIHILPTVAALSLAQAQSQAQVWRRAEHWTLPVAAVPPMDLPWWDAGAGALDTGHCLWVLVRKHSYGHTGHWPGPRAEMAMNIAMRHTQWL